VQVFPARPHLLVRVKICQAEAENAPDRSKTDRRLAPLRESGVIEALAAEPRQQSRAEFSLESTWQLQNNAFEPTSKNFLLELNRCINF
jgi:hypothetical protein